MFEGQVLDAVDLRVLAVLQRNARSTYAEIAEAVGLKPPAIHDRVKRLEQRGVLRGYGALLDTRRLGLGLTAFVSVYTTPEVSYDAFCAAVADLAEVCEVHSVAGEEAFILKVATRSTDHLDEFLSRLKLVVGIARTKTTIVLSTPFQRDGVALEALVDQTKPARLRAIGGE